MIYFLFTIALSLPAPLPPLFFWESPGERSQKPESESLFLSHMTWFQKASAFSTLKIPWILLAGDFPDSISMQFSQAHLIMRK